MPTVARGTFDVKLAPQAQEPGNAESKIAKLTIDKTFRGDLEGRSAGLMLSAGAPATGSAGYVAMEHVTGTLNGRAGSFALQHSGTMDRGAQQLTVSVVPGSGTEQLAGLSGTMRIIIAPDRTHSYELEYSLA
jgi:hypothetical protein